MTTTTVQLNLFGSPAVSAPVEHGLFAEIVFDRPLDHAYTYAVPEELRDGLVVGKRVQAPFGRGDRATAGYCVGLCETAPDRPVKQILDILDDEPLVTPHLLRLTRWMADYYLCGWGQVLHAVIPAGAREQAGTRASACLEAVPQELIAETDAKLTEKQTVALTHLRNASRPIEMRSLARTAKCGLGVLEKLIVKGLARRVTRRVDRFSATAQETDGQDTALVLNGDQQAAWAPIEEAVRNCGFRAFLLHGVTGSGKTELYLRAIEEVISRGKQALVLVPEISLTPQTIARFRGRCGEVAVLHSHLSDAERGGHWRRVHAGQVQVIVGARSAVFAPCQNLGLIVIDEEHEHTFKQESTPRYHARDVAVMRARLENIPILLGSATPSLESWHNAQRGQYTLLRLPTRVLERPMPPVQLIDLREEKPGRVRVSALSPSLELSMRETLRDGGQVMLLLNRRGFSTHVHCPSCGYVDNCRFCDLGLTYHRERDVMLCHYCGFEQPPPNRCPRCDQQAVRYQGLGTEKLQTEIEEKFPNFVIQRMDSDTMKRPGSHARVLKAFREGEIHVLLGTQMIAKGLDFPNVTLVGVINADVGLHFPDFRAAERTFQLLSQVAGRAGRGPRGGRVLVQTWNPEQPCIIWAARHDYVRFATDELASRKAHNYPPYQRLARVVIRSHGQEEGAEFAERVAGAFQAALPRLSPGPAGAPEVRILGPAEAPVFRLKGYCRYHFQLQSPSPGTLHQLLRMVLPTVRAPHGVELTVDVDPYNMM